MKSRIATLVLLVLVACGTRGEGPGHTAAEPGPTPPAPALAENEVVVLESIRFAGREGEVVAHPGVYIVEAWADASLRLTRRRSSEVLLVAAEAHDHELEIDSAAARLVRTEDDPGRILWWVAPGGRGLRSSAVSGEGRSRGLSLLAPFDPSIFNPPTITSPGFESTWTAGTIMPISWKFPNLLTLRPATITLCAEDGMPLMTIARTRFAHIWTIPDWQAPGTYRIHVSQGGTRVLSTPITIKPFTYDVPRVVAAGHHAGALGSASNHGWVWGHYAGALTDSPAAISEPVCMGGPLTDIETVTAGTGTFTFFVHVSDYVFWIGYVGAVLDERVATCDLEFVLGLQATDVSGFNALQHDRTVRRIVVPEGPHEVRPDLTDVRAMDTAYWGSSGGHTLALRGDGAVWGWGKDPGLGVPSIGCSHSTPIPAGTLGVSGTDVTAIAVGSARSYALLGDGTVKACGESPGDIGLGDDWSGPETNVWNTIPDLTGVQSIHAGYGHAFAIKWDGTVWAWGDNDHGQFGDGTTESASSPRQIEGLTGMVRIACGDGFTVFAKYDGTIWSCGQNDHGQLGDGTTTERHEPDLVGFD